MHLLWICQQLLDTRPINVFFMSLLPFRIYRGEWILGIFVLIFGQFQFAMPLDTTTQSMKLRKNSIVPHECALYRHNMYDRGHERSAVELYVYAKFQQIYSYGREFIQTFYGKKAISVFPEYFNFAFRLVTKKLSNFSLTFTQIISQFSNDVLTMSNSIWFLYI